MPHPFLGGSSQAPGPYPWLANDPRFFLQCLAHVQQYQGLQLQLEEPNGRLQRQVQD